MTEDLGRLVGLDDFERLAAKAYNEQYKRPYVCTLVADLLSGRWGVGSTQKEWAERLGMDRSRLSDAAHRGELRLEHFVRLRCYPGRPDDWEPDVERLGDDMERCAFIGVAQAVARRVPGRPSLVPEELHELNYELICEVYAELRAWFSPRSVATELAGRIVARVVADPRRNVVPDWYTDRERRQVESLLDRLGRERAAAHAHLTRLRENWLDVFALAFDLVSEISWSQYER